jgi:transposase-like protein
MTEAAAIEAKDAIRLALALEPATCNEQVIREVLGDRSVESLSEVAQTFGVAAATVRHTWRRDGMPGDAKKKHWPLADILIWFLKRNTKNAEARGADEFTKRKREAETKAAEADARIKERKAEEVEGVYVRLDIVLAVIKGIVNVARLMAIPRKMTPMFPAKAAAQYTAETERMLRHTLTMLSETTPDRVIERMKDDGNAPD